MQGNIKKYMQGVVKTFEPWREDKLLVFFFYILTENLVKKFIEAIKYVFWEHTFIQEKWKAQYTIIIGFVF